MLRSSPPVLSGLARTGPCSAADLGREVGLDRTTVTRRADRLERAGLVERRPDPADGRATLLALTDDGRTVIAATRQRLATGIEHALAAWPEADARDFARLLRRFVDEGPFAAGHDRPSRAVRAAGPVRAVRADGSTSWPRGGSSRRVRCRGRRFSPSCARP
ncbi:MarR family winged helix-turn-helix transcriptional regulator [Streptomyces sp. CB01881]|uniref:MarR family winged helix-turn-helix transcriptional regulator n=1 Tax=Streptomyces sp. CB01881 TaxID=2078691 RepID=UPI000CDCB038|nr:hypothetical protein C2142_37020 [Streptomyces sp. CB01881]TYC69806.1 MarR family transcriptional regulator [Streptomyces sp. CB01881]